MKNYRTLLLIFIPLFAYNQAYERTGKGIGLQLSASPFSLFQKQRGDNSWNNYDLSFSIVRTYKPGLYCKAGYSRFISHADLTGNFFYIGTGFDKYLLDFKVRKSRRNCIYRRLGLIGEVNYGRFYVKEQRNKALGEFNIKLGLSYHTQYKSMSKKSKNRSVHLEVFYHFGATPFLKTEGQQFNRHGIGVQIRFMKYKVYNFLE